MSRYCKTENRVGSEKSWQFRGRYFFSLYKEKRGYILSSYSHFHSSTYHTHFPVQKDRICANAAFRLRVRIGQGSNWLKSWVKSFTLQLPLLLFTYFNFFYFIIIFLVLLNSYSLLRVTCSKTGAIHFG